jgi:hypothetical protein
MEPEIFTLNFSGLKLTKENLRTAMGYSEDKVYPIPDEYMEEVFYSANDLCEIKGGYIIINNPVFNKDDFSLEFHGLSLQIGKIIFQQIINSSQVAIFICTAGNKIHDMSREFMKNDDMLKGYVYDLFGSLVVESAMDIIQENLANKLLSSGLKITNRYSPGYCGWNIAEQKKLFSILPESFCGVSLTDSCLMIPIKSISGLIGIGENVGYSSYTCNLCDSENCLYRNLKKNN